MADKITKVTPEEARDALASIRMMERAGWRRAITPRWVNAGHAILAAGVCATFALEPLKNMYFYAWAIVYVIFMGYIATHGSAFAREFPPPHGRRLHYFTSSLGILGVVVGSSMLRQTYDAPWISVVAGLIAGLWLFLYCEGERHYCEEKAGQRLNP